MNERMTAQKLKEFKGQEPQAWLTAYDFTQAQLAEEAGIDVILVGDSVGTTVMGYDSTLPVTLDDMLYHARLVRRGAPNTMMVVDLPYLSYTNPEQALQSAARFIKEALADAVKLEGGRRVLKQVDALILNDIPVVGHLGLTPQSVHAMGGYKVQARTHQAMTDLVDDARALQDHGVCSLVLEGIPDRVAAYVTETIGVPTIGIGAGNGTDGQVLVFHDCLGLSSRYPKFAKPFTNLRQVILDGMGAFVGEVRSRSFPDDSHSYHVTDKEWETFWDRKAGR